MTVGPVDAALGLRAVTLSLVNCGVAPRPVEGYPGLALLDEQRRVLDVRVSQEVDPVGNGGAAGPTGLTLAPGEQAQAVLLWRNTVEAGPETAPGSYLAVTPLPGADPQVVPLDVDLGTTGLLRVGPWTPAP